MKASKPAPARHPDRFPRFTEEYRQHWIDAGLWQNRTLHDLFDETVAAQPDKVAVASKERRMTFGEWKAESDALAAGLLGVGIGPGDIVAVQLPNWIEMCLLQIALSRIGAVIQPMHVVYREREMRSLLLFCESDAIVVPCSYGDFDYAAAVQAMRSELPDLRLLVVARCDVEGAGALSLDDLILEGRSNLDRLTTVHPDPDDVFYLNFTSGTEGDPKGFLHTHNTLISSFKSMAEMMRQFVPDTVNLANSPMTHSFGHFTTYQTALGGFPMVLIDRYRPLDVLELIEREHVSTLSGTPAHLIGILHHPRFAEFDTSSVKNVSVGGARSSPELIGELEKVWSVKSANTYGLGENLAHTRTMPWDPEDKIRETVGKPLPGTELRIVDPMDRATERAQGDIGEIAFRGPTLFLAYYRQPELTAACRDDAGWFYTGDLGSVDEDGYLHFVGRGGEVINRGGTKIYPKEIEDLLLAHPDIEDAAVVGWPDERLGEQVAAYIVPVTGREVDLDSLRTYLVGQRVMKYKVPEHLVVVESLPMTPTGKVRKVTLQDDAARRSKETGRI